MAASSTSRSSVASSTIGLPRMLLAPTGRRDKVVHVVRGRCHTRQAGPPAGRREGARPTRPRPAAEADGSPVSRRATRTNRSSRSASPPRASSARTFALMTCGSSAAHTAPCGAGNRPPMGAANPCTAPRAALARASPPKRLPSAMSVRASRSLPSAHGAAQARAPRAASASRQIASVSGLALHGDVRLDQLRERVHPGRCGERGRKRQRQLGIDDGQRRQHQRAAQAHLLPLFGHAQHGVPRHLRARAGRRRHGDERHGALGERLAAAHDFEVVERVARIREERRDSLAEVDRAAAAARDDDVGTVLPWRPRLPLEPTATVGSPSTGHRSSGRPLALSDAMTSADGAPDLPVTTSAREPIVPARSPTVVLAPGPNTISVAVANANCTVLPAALRQPRPRRRRRRLAVRPSTSRRCRARSGSGPSSCARRRPPGRDRPRRARTAWGRRVAAGRRSGRRRARGGSGVRCASVAVSNAATASAFTCTLTIAMCMVGSRFQLRCGPNGSRCRPFAAAP